MDGEEVVQLYTSSQNKNIHAPVKALKEVLDIFKPFIHVVNVDSEHYVEVTEEYKAERAKLEKILDGYETEYYFIRQFDFIDAINQFVEDYKIDMIFTVPKNHSFLRRFKSKQK